MSDPNPDVVRSNRRGAILEVTLDRPKANAIDLATSRLLGKTFKDFRDEPELRVAIDTNAGDEFFSTGWDLKAEGGGHAVDGDDGVGGVGSLSVPPTHTKPGPP